MDTGLGEDGAMRAADIVDVLVVVVEGVVVEERVVAVVVGEVVGILDLSLRKMERINQKIQTSQAPSHRLVKITNQNQMMDLKNLKKLREVNAVESGQAVGNLETLDMELVTLDMELVTGAGEDVVCHTDILVILDTEDLAGWAFTVFTVVVDIQL